MSERKEKFTPGPWHILIPKPRYGNRECHSIVDGGGEYVAKTVAVSVLRGISAVKREERKANEHLISAAPEMYAELSDLLDAMESGLFPQVAPGVDYPAVMEKKWELQKLLKKARGEE